MFSPGTVWRGIASWWWGTPPTPSHPGPASQKSRQLPDAQWQVHTCFPLLFSTCHNEATQTSLTERDFYSFRNKPLKRKKNHLMKWFYLFPGINIFLYSFYGSTNCNNVVMSVFKKREKKKQPRWAESSHNLKISPHLITTFPCSWRMSMSDWWVSMFSFKKEKKNTILPNCNTKLEGTQVLREVNWYNSTLSFPAPADSGSTARWQRFTDFTFI